MVLDETAIAGVIDQPTLARGAKVRAQGQIIDVDINDAGTVLVGRVRGTDPKPYSQMVTLRQGRHTLTITGRCSCPVQKNCKHVAAILLEAMARQSRPAVTAALEPSETGRVVAASRDRVVVGGLSPGVAGWLADLDAACRAPPGGSYPAGVRQRIVYVLSCEPSGRSTTGRAMLSPLVATLRDDGQFDSNVRAFSPANIDQRTVPPFVSAADRSLLLEMLWMMRGSGRGTEQSASLEAGPQGTSVLVKALATGRCRFGDATGPALALGDPLAAKPAWRAQTSGGQRLVFEAADDDGVIEALAMVLPLSPPYYVDLDKGLAGCIASSLPDALAQHLASAPEVPAGEVGSFSSALGRRLAAAGMTDVLSLPQSGIAVETRIIAPTPRLTLGLARARVKQQFAWSARGSQHEGPFEVALARLAFDYGGETVVIHAAHDTLERLVEGRVIITPRDHKREVAAAETLAGLGFRMLKDTPIDGGEAHGRDLLLTPGDALNVVDFLSTLDNPERYLTFINDVAPRLRAMGWEIVQGEDFPHKLADGEAQWWADAAIGEGIDWLSFGVGIAFEGHHINLVPTLAEMVARLPSELTVLADSANEDDVRAFADAIAGMTVYHRLPDGRHLRLPGERLVPVLRSMLGLVGTVETRIDGDTIRVHRSEAGPLAALSDDATAIDVWSGEARDLATLGSLLRRGPQPDVIRVPEWFRAQLRPYQREGVAWLAFLRASGFGGVLADDMGLGKTVQALAFLACEKAEGRLDKPALIVAPTSVLPNWRAEAERFAPELSVLVLQGSERQQSFANIGHHDVVLTTYPLLMRDAPVLLGQTFHVAILDEAQAIKNPKATVSGLAHRLDARQRIALTGTPLENNLGEVWSLFQYLVPGLLGDEATFRRTFRTPIEKHGSETAQAMLSAKLKPFMLRRTKAEVATELPPKTEIIERIQLAGAQRDLYETVRALMHERVREEIAIKGLAKSHIVFLDALLKLRQICCDPRLLKMTEAKNVRQSAKMERLMEMIPEMVGEGRRILLFSQFTSMLDLIAEALSSVAVPFVRLTGDTGDRAEPVRAFQGGEVPVFLLSLKAGGTGLNLTAADTVIHYDPWWNPAVERQATDRAYRIGQEKPVFVYKMIVEDGIEEAIEMLKSRKAALADALFAGTAKDGLDLSEDDIQALFQPLDGRAGRKAA